MEVMLPCGRRGTVSFVKRRSSPGIAPRLWAVASLVLAMAAIALAVALAVDSLARGLGVFACALAAASTAWFGLRRRGSVRIAGEFVAALLLIGALALVVLEGEWLGNLLVLVGVAASLASARIAFRAHVHLPQAPAPKHPVLFYNPRSGDGKAGRYRLAQEARRRGIEAVELAPGMDLEELVRGAVARGADALAMAGGDGSQAIVAALAAEFELPYACIPAGTRNHFALDLGVDRDDVVGALDALVNGGERRVDLAEVNGRVFVNNVSLGLYAEAVRRPGYREAKLHTLLSTVPDVLGPGAQPRALSWEGRADGEPAVAVLISNDPYRLARALGSGMRPRLDRGVLGIAALGPAAHSRTAGPPPALGLRMRQWTADTFEVDATTPVPAGIDGESVLLTPPLRFRSRRGVLRVRIAPGHPGCSPAALLPERQGQLLLALLGLAVHGTPSGLAAGTEPPASRAADRPAARSSAT